MGLLNFFRGKKENTAKLAKERLQIIIAHERAQSQTTSHEFLPKLEKELIEVIRRYVPIHDDAVKVKLDRDGDLEVLELNIVLPEQGGKD